MAMRKSAIVVSLDFVGTLITNSYLDHFWRESIPRAYAGKKGIPFEEAKRLVLKEYERVSVDDIDWYLPEYWLNRFSINCDLTTLIEDSLKALEFYSDSLDFVNRFKDKCEMIITSNVPSSLIFPSLDLMGFKFRKVYSSADARIVGKPPSFYKLILRDLGVPSSSVIHIGDDEVNDVENPRKVGIKSYLINRKAGLTLNSLVAVVERSLNPNTKP